MRGEKEAKERREELFRLLAESEDTEALTATLIRRTVTQAEAEEPEWGALLRAAAIPRRLDGGVVSVLRGEPDDADGNRAALQRLAAFPFVLPDPEGRSYALHEEVRTVLLEDWQAPERRARYVELSRALHDHYRGLAETEQFVPFPPSLLESLYHRFTFDPAGAFGEFEWRFYEADVFYRRAECSALLAAAEEQERELNEGQRLWLRHYRARLALVLDRWTEAEEQYRALLADLSPLPVEGEGLGVRVKLCTWTLHDLGLALDSQGKWTEAVEVYQEALKGRRELGDRHGKGLTLGNLGELYTKCGSWAEAKENLEQSLSILQELGDPQNAAEALHYLGEWHKGQGQLDEAIARYKEALAVRQELEAWPQVGETLHALAEVYAIRGDWAQAAEMAEQAAEAWRKTQITGHHV